ncbi:MAG: hypothetical protein GY940_05725, partial [bacterium]|nr:hypothetical protein [bacterium]
SDLTYLNLSQNQLTGNILAELGNLSKLFFLSLSQNRFSFFIPPESANLTRLTHP